MFVTKELVANGIGGLCRLSKRREQGMNGKTYEFYAKPAEKFEKKKKGMVRRA